MELQSLSKNKKISPIVRVVSGVIGLLGFAAIAFNASQAGGLELNFMLFASFFAGFIFLYVSFFGKYPWDKSNANTGDS
jgi:hypothetical protein